VLSPNVLDVGAAVESAISASGADPRPLRKDEGHDAAPYVRGAQKRREQVDALMRRAATSIWARYTSRAA